MARQTPSMMVNDYKSPEKKRKKNRNIKFGRKVKSELHKALFASFLKGRQ